MKFASDQNATQKVRSHTSLRMLELRDAVLSEWEQSVRASIPQTKNLLHPILIDTLPAFYDYIAEAVSDAEQGIYALDCTSIPAEHGGERARLTNFDYMALITEYHIFRKTVLDVLYKNNVQLSHHETLTVNALFDIAIRESVNAFSLVHAALREQFIAALTHDLRDPLSTAKMTAELIMMIDDPVKMKDYAAKVSDHLSRMNEMIQQLLNSIMFENHQYSTLDLTYLDIIDLVREVQTQAAGIHGERIEVTGNAVKGWWDRESMKRLLENLISNAIKYGDEDKPISIKALEVHERLLLTVHNEGPPIPEEEQEGIFQIFRRAHSAKQGYKDGWGIGLSFVRGVAESHGGCVCVQSTQERGTTFLIDVPMDSRPFQNSPTLT